MKNKKSLLLTFAVLCFTASLALCQNFDINKKIPVDPNILTGKLNNGLTYYIKKNAKPENKVVLRLAINAGSILEDDDQQGLAHFVEHMGFNGTKNFEKNELVSYLQSIGVEFGADLNAYTSFDETVYMLPVPTTRPGLVDTGLMVLEDWAFNIQFKDEEIDKERGVILEELRSGQGAQQRLRDKYFPQIFKNSQYAVRLPIGKKELIETFPYKNIIRFYKDWYRPDLMAVVAVGDLEPNEMKKKIEKHFGSYHNPKTIRKRKVFNVADHKETFISIATDKEMPYTMIQLIFKDNVEETNNWGDYRRNVVQEMYNGMMSTRLDELKQSADPPFFMGYSGYSSFVRAKNAFISFAVVGPDGVEKGLKSLLTENERVRKFGFIEVELERFKLDYLKNLEKAFLEKEKTESSNYVSEYVRNFLSQEPIPGIEKEFEFTKSILNSIKVEEVNKLAGRWIKDFNRVVIIAGPEKEEIIMPTEEQVRQWLVESEQMEVTAYKDELVNAVLMEPLPENNGKILSKGKEEIGYTKALLSNNVEVILKPTDFKNDEILLKAYSIGGTSLHSVDEFQSANHAADLIAQSGVNEYSSTDLDKLMAGKTVSLSPFIGTLTEGFDGSCSPEDFETLLQLIYLHFTKPNYDEEAFQSMITKEKMLYPNLLADPGTYYNDQANRILKRNHPRGNYMLTLEDIEKVTLEDAYDVYLNRFADADDFTFFFVGNFDVDKVLPLLNKYLGSLPTIAGNEMWKDHGMRPPKGKVEKVINKGQDQKSIAQIIFTGEVPYKEKDAYLFTVLSDVLNIKLIENLREKMSGVYGTGSRASMHKYPYENYRFTIYIPCGPENVDKLVDAAITEVNKIIENGPTNEDLEKVRKTNLINYQENLKENRYWINQLYRSRYYDTNPINIPKKEELINSVSVKEIQEIANKYLKTDEYIKIILMPEE